MRVRVKHINRVKGRDGKVRLYHRLTGERLPDDPEAAALRAAAINAGHIDKTDAKAIPGTFADLIGRYKISPEWRTEISDVTRKDYLPHLDAIRKAWGHLPVTGIRNKHIKAMRDSLVETPRKANLRLSVLSRIYTFGIGSDDELFGQINPVSVFYKGNKKLREGDGYHPWPDNVIAAFQEAAYPELRDIVIGGALGTGQRGEDLVAMTVPHVGPTHWEFRQLKGRHRTDTWIELPHTAEFRAIVDRLPKDRMLVFVTRTGKQWSLPHLRHEVQRVMAEIGFPGYTLHGLRYKAARRLRLAGASWEDIAAVLGHRAVKMARQYSEREERATNAISLLSAKSSAETAKHVATDDE